MISQVVDVVHQSLLPVLKKLVIWGDFSENFFVNLFEVLTYQCLSVKFGSNVVSRFHHLSYHGDLVVRYVQNVECLDDLICHKSESKLLTKKNLFTHEPAQILQWWCAFSNSTSTVQSNFCFAKIHFNAKNNTKWKDFQFYFLFYVFTVFFILLSIWWQS